MTPQELYAREPEKITYDFLTYLCPVDQSFNHVPEIEPNWNDTFSPSQNIQIRIYKHFNFDYKRTWTLAGVYILQDIPNQISPCYQPVMIIQNAGRHGCDIVNRFVTDQSLYKRLIETINLLRVLAIDETQLKDSFVGLNQEIDNLSHFYDHDLDGWFQKF